MALNILFLNTSQDGGGASKIARILLNYFDFNNYECKLLVKRKIKEERNIEQLHFGNKFIVYFHYLLSLMHRFLGFEYFPTLQSIRLRRYLTDNTIVNLHNIHGDLFDIDFINKIPDTIPVIITMHDSWYYTGHCAHHFDCDNWRNMNCSPCLYPSTPPKIVFDNAKRNRLYKLNALKRRSNLILVSPSSWLLNELNSIDELEFVEKILIPNGINLNVFWPVDRSQYKNNIEDVNSPFVIVSTASSIEKNPFKFFDLALLSIRKLSLCANKEITFLCIGSNSPDINEGNLTVKFIPFSDQNTVASIMRQGHVFLHLAKAETFGLVIIEAMASGLPVVASNIGGITDLVINGINGYLVENKTKNVVDALLCMINQTDLLFRLSNGAVLTAKNYDETIMCERYLQLFQRMTNEDFK
jgi:glycosyltransferase involved in cell wall biosynthesis